MPEVAERCEPNAAVGEDAPGLPGIERSPREGERAFLYRELRDQAAHEGQKGRRVDHQPPVQPPEPVYEVGNCVSHDQRPGQRPERHPAAFLEPRGDQLEGRRVDAGEEESRNEA